MCKRESDRKLEINVDSYVSHVCVIDAVWCVCTAKLLFDARTDDNPSHDPQIVGGSNSV
eukprot:m.263464 g.263464  ORF g.263464 m.263464 type:complete len:59 (-) comp50547_c0_seq1:1150-1326(-)